MHQYWEKLFKKTLFRFWFVLFFALGLFTTSEKPSHPDFEVISDGESVKHLSKIKVDHTHP